jgi:death-on-curing protein
VKTKEPIWIEERDVLAIHGRLLTIHGGAQGIRDLGLLQSALARPRQHYAYAESQEIVELSALYTAGIVKNHPFADGNKRTGFVTGILFLELNGWAFHANEEDATHAIMSLAAGELSEQGYTTWLRANSHPKKR